ncbi:uncharacterized protein EV420DRAFT_1746712 [Desarmillaria tabescens]|uniref:Uncharacterized protein n=1 Tax=Armillaria tabescens TaxID=1929756 RepID=A0AA39KGI4_ARMTA|nr:uncharacterized protein EV420DRAFT_1746712 [Desarmillaria tabescens]KAK0460388.1 hypothetical protein EV420DRAFT_1746712 [Desarmillaria tabescens]
MTNDEIASLIEFPVAVRYPQGPGKQNKQSVEWQLKKGDLKLLKFILSAVRNISERIQESGCSCYLSGPKDVSWFILGAPVIPMTDIWFYVDPSNGMTLDDLFQKLGVVKRNNNTFNYTDDNSQRTCKILIEQAPSPESLGLNPTLAYGSTKDRIPIYNPGITLFSHLTQPRLRNAILADYGLPERTYEQIVPVLKDLSKANVDLRKAFLDGEERNRLDELVKGVCAVHEDLKGVFANLGFVTPEEEKPIVDTAPVQIQQEEHNPRDDIVFEAATMTMKMLSDAGYHCAVSGMVASYLQANDAELPLPDSTEITVFSHDDIKVIERLLSKHSLFYTGRVKVPGSDTKSQVLFYRIRGRGRGARKWKLSKVHFVMAQEWISYEIKEGLPLVPRSTLLVDMLQLWYDRVLNESQEVGKYAAYVWALLKAVKEEENFICKRSPFSGAQGAEEYIESLQFGGRGKGHHVRQDFRFLSKTPWQSDPSLRI